MNQFQQYRRGRGFACFVNYTKYSRGKPHHPVMLAISVKGILVIAAAAGKSLCYNYYYFTLIIII
jgi:hypothetical protein